MLREVHIVSAFTDAGRGGNPAGVVLNADDLTAAQKLQLAARIGLSETAFVSASDVADVKLEFFTPNRQIAHCGHATIATFSYLAQTGLLHKAESSKETIDGVRQIRLQQQFAYMEQRAPKFQALGKDEALVQRAFGLSARQLTHAPVLVNTGNSFILFGVADFATLQALKPDHDLMLELSERYELIGFYPFSRQSATAGTVASARMFGPRYGITEEAATGMAAGPLACLLYPELKISQMQIEQGSAMLPPSPSRIYVDLQLSQGKITGLFAGGLGKRLESRIIAVD